MEAVKLPPGTRQRQSARTEKLRKARSEKVQAKCSRDAELPERDSKTRRKKWRQHRRETQPKLLRSAWEALKRPPIDAATVIEVEQLEVAPAPQTGATDPHLPVRTTEQGGQNSTATPSLKRQACKDVALEMGEHQIGCEVHRGTAIVSMCSSRAEPNHFNQPHPEQKRQRTYAEIASPVAPTTSPIAATGAAVLASPYPASSVPLNPLPAPALQYNLQNLDELLLQIFIQSKCTDRLDLEEILQKSACNLHKHLTTLPAICHGCDCAEWGRQLAVSHGLTPDTMLNSDSKYMLKINDHIRTNSTN